MNDESTDTNGQEIFEHPWVQAAINVPMQPTPSAVELDDVELTIDGRKVKAALLTVADPSGVRTAFLPPSMLAELVAKGLEIIEGWEKEEQSGLVVAGPGTNVHNIAQAMQNIRGKS